MYRVTLTMVCLAMLTFVGCGGGGPVRPPGNPVSGSVTFDGDPLEKGEIEIIPDAEMDVAGPAAIVPIENGKYATKEGKGVVPGHANVRITVYGAPADVGEDVPEEERGAAFEVLGVALERVEVAEGDNTFDFDLTKADFRSEEE